MIDYFFRATDKQAMRNVLTSNAFKRLLGDLVNEEVEGSILGANGVDFALVPPVVIARDEDGVPTNIDSATWVQMRLTGDKDIADRLDDGEGDRWDRSAIVSKMKELGSLRTIRGCTVYEYTLPGGKKFQVWRGQDLERLGIRPHEFQGGNTY